MTITVPTSLAIVQSGFPATVAAWPVWTVWAAVGLALFLALAALGLGAQALSKTKQIALIVQARRSAFLDPAVSTPLQKLEDAPPSEPDKAADYRRLYDHYLTLQERVKTLEAELLRVRGATEPVSVSPPNKRGSLNSTPPSLPQTAMSGRGQTDPREVRHRTAAIAAKLRDTFERPYPLQAEASRAGARFFRLSANGDLVAEDVGGAHSDRWFMATPDLASGSFSLHFGPRVMREKTKLRVSAEFLTALSAYFEVDHGYQNLEEVQPAVVEIASGGLRVIDRGLIQA